MKHLHDVRNEYTTGKITKPKFIDRMYGFHATLFDYAEYLRNTDISRIEISDDSVILTTRSAIKFSCMSRDKRLPPLESLNFGAYEKQETAFLVKLATNSSTILDIGANIGWYSLAFAKAYPQAIIHSFEPIPHTFSALKKNIGLNGFTNIHAHQFGFSDHNDTLTFFYYPEGSGNASSANLTGSKHTEKIICKVRMMDTFVRESKTRIDLVKCDVEGAELFVFRGGMDTIIRDTPIVFSEILRKWSKKFHYDPNEIITLFVKAGYGCFTINDTRLRKFSVMNDETKDTNFLFLHTKKHAGVIKKYTK